VALIALRVQSDRQIGDRAAFRSSLYVDALQRLFECHIRKPQVIFDAFFNMRAFVQRIIELQALPKSQDNGRAPKCKRV
jgi:hypothetical protein